MAFKKNIVKLGLLLGCWQGMAFGQSVVPQTLIDLRDQWEKISPKCTVQTDDSSRNFPAKTQITFITKHGSGDPDCSTKYATSKDWSVLSPFADSILFSSVLCDSDPDKYSWACDSIAASQGANGRFYRTVLSLQAETKNQTQIAQNSFSMDQTLGVLLYLETMSRKNPEKAKDIANKFWDYIRGEKKKLLGGYRVCPPSSGGDAYCAFNPGELALFKIVFNSIQAVPIPDDKSGKAEDFENTLWLGCSTAVISNKYSFCHLAAMTDLILKRAHYFPVNDSMKLPVLDNRASITPRRLSFNGNTNNTFIQWVTVGSGTAGSIIKNKTASELATDNSLSSNIQKICDPVRMIKVPGEPEKPDIVPGAPGTNFLWEQANIVTRWPRPTPDPIPTKTLGQASPTGWDCVEMLSYIINNYETDFVNYTTK